MAYNIIMSESHMLSNPDAGGESKGSHISPNDVVRRLSAYIQKYNLQPGNRLPSIRELGDSWQINRNVVRDGFQRAESIGLIQLHPRAGAFVKEFDYRQVSDIFSSLVEVILNQSRPPIVYYYDARILIESGVIRRTAERRTEEDLFELWSLIGRMEEAPDREEFVRFDELFHLTIARISGNPVLSNMLEVLFAALRPYRVSESPGGEIRAEIHQVHRKIYQAILDQDQELASELVSAHVVHHRQQLLEPMLNNQPSKL